MIRCRQVLIAAAALALSACSEPGAGPAPPLAASLGGGGTGLPAVLVNPRGNGNGIASTIQEGIDRVAPGGRVMVLPGTYVETLVIDKALTLEGIAGGSGPAIIHPAGTPFIAVEITGSPVTIRDVSLQFSGALGIYAYGDAVDLTLERLAITEVNPSSDGGLIALDNDARTSSGRGRLTVRESSLDGGITLRPAPFPRNFGIRSFGDVDAIVSGNVIRRIGAACIYILARDDLGGETNAEILNNDLDECHPLARAGYILVGPGAPVAPGTPVTATGVVNIVGNTLRNTEATCWPATAISYEMFGGRIERNRILGVVQSCAVAGWRNLPAAIWVGGRSALPAATPVVRYNDIVGNAQAGLRIGPNQGAAIDATCNWWGSATGPSGVGSGSGDALVLQGGAATPSFTPFATAPIAGSSETSCSGGST